MTTRFSAASAPRAPGQSSPDLSAHSDNLEWWFVQGRIDGIETGAYHFMFAFFRHAGLEDRMDGHMLLVAGLDAAGKRHSAASRISPQLLHNFNRDAPGKLRQSVLDQVTAGAVLDEIAHGGPPRPIRLADMEARVASEPLAINWGDFTFAQGDDGLAFSFLLPGTDRVCRVTAKPRIPWFEGRDLGNEVTGFMAYDCCPRLHLTGDLDGAPISGTAWADHQWGGLDWIATPGDMSIVPGWDWLGINLDDGRDLIVIVHRNMATLEPVGQFAVLFDEAGTTRVLDNLTVEPTGVWRSRETMIDYPVRCRIDIPDLAASFDFEPFAEDQEVPVLGVNGAIWEGAGGISGTFAGRHVSGRARLELQGYGYVGEFEDIQKKWIDRIDRTLAGFLPKELDQDRLVSYLDEPRWAYDAAAQSQMLAEPVWDLLSRGGKHWRPVFGLLLLEALGTDVAPYELMLSTVPELIHNGSLMVDDIEDSSITRRGDDSLHLRYGVPTAINAGNTLYFLPMMTVLQSSELTTRQRDAVFRVYTEMMTRAHFGQAQDLYWSRLAPAAAVQAFDDPMTLQLILQVHAFKSAAAVKAMAEIACIIAETDAETRATCVRLAESWGVAFQITDDVNNFSSSQRWGKLRGEDVREGKVTYVTHSAVQRLAGAEKARLLDILTTKALRDGDEGLAEAIALIERSGALEASRSEARQLYVADWPPLSRLLPNSYPKFMLRATLDKLLGGPFET